jgi:hypothetical protein
MGRAFETLVKPVDLGWSGLAVSTGLWGMQSGRLPLVSGLPKTGADYSGTCLS